MKTKKKIMISIQIYEEESKMISKMRDEHDVNLSALLRRSIKNKYKELYPEE